MTYCGRSQLTKSCRAFVWVVCRCYLLQVPAIRTAESFISMSLAGRPTSGVLQSVACCMMSHYSLAVMQCHKCYHHKIAVLARVEFYCGICNHMAANGLETKFAGTSCHMTTLLDMSVLYLLLQQMIQLLIQALYGNAMFRWHSACCSPGNISAAIFSQSCRLLPISQAQQAFTSQPCSSQSACSFFTMRTMASNCGVQPDCRNTDLGGRNRSA